jgi:hypothetical protein
VATSGSEVDDDRVQRARDGRGDETAQLTKQVQDWLDAQDEATRNRHAAIRREVGLD